MKLLRMIINLKSKPLILWLVRRLPSPVTCPNSKASLLHIITSKIQTLIKFDSRLPSLILIYG